MRAAADRASCDLLRHVWLARYRSLFTTRFHYMTSRSNEERNADFENRVPLNIGVDRSNKQRIYENMNVRELRGTYPGKESTVPVSVPYLRVSAKLSPVSEALTNFDLSAFGARFWPTGDALKELLRSFPPLTIRWDTSQAGSSRLNAVALAPGTIYEFRAQIAMRPFYRQGMWFTEYTLYRWEVWLLRTSVLMQSAKVRLIPRACRTGHHGHIRKSDLAG